MSTPFLVAEVIADTIPIGVEIKNAHGQEITKKTSALYILPLVPKYSIPETNGKVKPIIIARIIIIGV